MNCAGVFGKQTKSRSLGEPVHTSNQLFESSCTLRIRSGNGKQFTENVEIRLGQMKRRDYRFGRKESVTPTERGRPDMTTGLQR